MSDNNDRIGQMWLSKFSYLGQIMLNDRSKLIGSFWKSKNHKQHIVFLLEQQINELSFEPEPGFNIMNDEGHLGWVSFSFLVKFYTLMNTTLMIFFIMKIIMIKKILCG